MKALARGAFCQLKIVEPAARTLECLNRPRLLWMLNPPLNTCQKHDLARVSTITREPDRSFHHPPTIALIAFRMALAFSAASSGELAFRHIR